MNPVIIDILAVAAGTCIGLLFGKIQEKAARRYIRLQQENKFANGWAVMPGSFTRIAYFLVALVGVQLICPRFFTDGTQWYVSGGVVLGYALMLARQFGLRAAEARS